MPSSQVTTDAVTTPRIGSIWVKNPRGGWTPLYDSEVHMVRVEQFTPTGRVVLRRLDSDHEFIFDVVTLKTAFDPVEGKDLDRALNEAIQALRSDRGY